MRNKKNLNENIVVGELARPGLNISKILRVFLPIAAVVIVVGGVGGGLLYYHIENEPGHKAAFVIKGKKYSRNYVENLIAYPGVSKTVSSSNQLARTAFNDLKNQTVANQLGIQVSQNAINQQINDELNGNPNKSSLLTNQWIMLTAYNTVLTSELNQGNTSDYQGYSFIFYYGNKIAFNPRVSYSDFGNSSSIAKDRQYAQDQANFYYTKLKDNKMTPDQVLSAVNSDPRLGIEYKANTNQSVHFGIGSELNWQSQVYWPSPINYISNAIGTGLSGVTTGQSQVYSSAAAVASNTSTNAGTYFYIVELDQLGGRSVSLQTFYQTAKTLPATFYGLQ